PAEFTVSKPLIHNYTLDLSAQQGVFAVATQSRDSVSLSLEKRNDNGAWQGIANASGSNALLLAAIDNSVGSGKSYRLKVWSSEQRGAKISVSARLLKTPESPEASLSRGLELISEALLSGRLSAARIQLKSPGMFKVSPQTGSTLFWAGEKDEQLQAYDGFISSADNIWLVSPETSQTLQATRVVLEDDTLQFNVGTNTPVWIDTHNNPGGYDLVVAESRIGLPGVSVLAQNKLDARTMGVGLSSSMALVNSVPQAGKSRIKVWDSGSGGTLLPVRLNRYQFNQPARQQLSAGSHDATLPSQAAISFDLQGGLKDVRFNLPQGVAAVLLKKGEVQRSFWSDKKAQNYQLWSDADSLLILNTLSKERVLAILLNPTANVVKLSPETLFKHYFAGSGNFSLSPDLTVPPGSYLHAWGEQTQLLVQTRQGQVFRGKQVPISGDVLVNVS
ncbi:MAG: hypothetical protein GY770_26520, partial [Aestuariibacter sp.]|nr:hypothetical protein [Aestuariibacter sp.]